MDQVLESRRRDEEKVRLTERIEKILQRSKSAEAIIPASTRESEASLGLKARPLTRPNSISLPVKHEEMHLAHAVAEMLAEHEQATLDRLWEEEYERGESDLDYGASILGLGEATDEEDQTLSTSSGEESEVTDLESIGIRDAGGYSNPSSDIEGFEERHGDLSSVSTQGSEIFFGSEPVSLTQSADAVLPPPPD